MLLPQFGHPQPDDPFSGLDDSAVFREEKVASTCSDYRTARCETDFLRYTTHSAWR
jgi:hypothetical protein